MPAYWVLQKRVMPNTSRPEYHVHGKDWRPFDSLGEAWRIAEELADAMCENPLGEPFYMRPVYSFKVLAEVESGQ